MKRYKQLMDLPGISGYESQIRDFMKHEMEKHPSYQIHQDRLGSIFAVKPAIDKQAPVVMVAGHMDEVGLMVVKITKEGFLKVQAIGGLSGETFISQVVNVYTRKAVIKGVIGNIPPHFKKEQSVKIDDLLVDIGAESKQDALDYGVSLGDMVLFDNPYAQTANPNRIISKAVDNRYGCGLALDIIDHFADKELPYTLVVGATVQEEVGLRGAETSANYFKPNIFIALDASPVNELDPDNLASLGKGFLIRMHDPRNIMDQRLLHYFETIAKENRILHQHFLSKGGTDAAVVLDLQEGVLATTIGLPARYIHSTAAMMDIRDIQAARKMIYHVLSDLTPEKIENLTYNKTI